MGGYGVTGLGGAVVDHEVAGRQVCEDGAGLAYQGGFGRRANGLLPWLRRLMPGAASGPSGVASGRAQPAACVVAAQDERLRRGSVPVTGADQAFRG
ncbi:hypothetical protein GCM10010271_71330 [Streptomyces kurssanovii]|nr:hypothetical protein GCM10010271_71330 [Streptomyces kurssanovii]